MRNSSANQLAFEYGESQEAGRSQPGSHPEAKNVSNASTTAQKQFPDFGAASEAYAATARIAGRMNAATASNEEIQGLLRERQSLLDKKFAGTITRREHNRLEYVRWSLDRIDDAQQGTGMDALERLVARYERFAEDVEALQVQLNRHLPRRK